MVSTNELSEYETTSLSVGNTAYPENINYILTFIKLWDRPVSTDPANEEPLGNEEESEVGGNSSPEEEEEEEEEEHDPEKEEMKKLGLPIRFNYKAATTKLKKRKKHRIKSKPNTSDPSENIFGKEWEDYWAKHGQTLVYESWCKRYEKYMSNPGEDSPTNTDGKTEDGTMQPKDSHSSSRPASPLPSLISADHLPSSEKKNGELYTDQEVEMCQESLQQQQNGEMVNKPMKNCGYNAVAIKLSHLDRELEAPSMDQKKGDAVDTSQIVEIENSLDSSSPAATAELVSSFKKEELEEDGSQEILPAETENGAEEMAQSKEELYTQVWNSLWDQHCREVYESQCKIFFAAKNAQNVEDFEDAIYENWDGYDECEKEEDEKDDPYYSAKSNREDNWQHQDTTVHRHIKYTDEEEEILENFDDAFEAMNPTEVGQSLGPDGDRQRDAEGMPTMDNTKSECPHLQDVDMDKCGGVPDDSKPCSEMDLDSDGPPEEVPIHGTLGKMVPIQGTVFRGSELLVFEDKTLHAKSSSDTSSGASPQSPNNRDESSTDRDNVFSGKNPTEAGETGPRRSGEDSRSVEDRTLLTQDNTKSECHHLQDVDMDKGGGSVPDDSKPCSEMDLDSDGPPEEVPIHGTPGKMVPIQGTIFKPGPQGDDEEIQDGSNNEREDESSDNNEAPASPDEEKWEDNQEQNQQDYQTSCNPEEIRRDPALRKYYANRLSLFSRYDEGIELDRESWWSVTPERIAEHIAQRVASVTDVVVDGFCGAGGNAIQFAKHCKRVIAVDIDVNKLKLVRNNARIYGVESSIDVICGNFLHLGSAFKAGAVFLSPPWGGPGYKHEPEFYLKNITPPMGEVMRVARQISPNIVFFAPKNTVLQDMLSLALPEERVEIQMIYLGGRVKAIAVYYGDFPTDEAAIQQTPVDDS